VKEKLVFHLVKWICLLHYMTSYNSSDIITIKNINCVSDNAVQISYETSY